MNIQQAQHILLSDFLVMAGLTLLTVAGYETDILPQMDVEGMETEIFVWQVGMELLSIIAIPLALKLFKLTFVRRQLARSKGRALVKWGIIRIELLCIPMLVNTFMYYQTMSPAFGYLAIIIFLCLFFVYPSIDRCVVETEDEQPRKINEEKEYKGKEYEEEGRKEEGKL